MLKKSYTFTEVINDFRAYQKQYAIANAKINTYIMLPDGVYDLSSAKRAISQLEVIQNMEKGLSIFHKRLLKLKAKDDHETVMIEGAKDLLKVQSVGTISNAIQLRKKLALVHVVFYNEEKKIDRKKDLIKAAFDFITDAMTLLKEHQEPLIEIGLADDHLQEVQNKIKREWLLYFTDNHNLDQIQILRRQAKETKNKNEAEKYLLEARRLSVDPVQTFHLLYELIFLYGFVKETFNTHFKGKKLVASKTETVEKIVSYIDQITLHILENMEALNNNIGNGDLQSIEANIFVISEYLFELINEDSIKVDYELQESILKPIKTLLDAWHRLPNRSVDMIERHQTLSQQFQDHLDIVKVVKDYDVNFPELLKKFTNDNISENESKLLQYQSEDWEVPAEEKKVSSRIPAELTKSEEESISQQEQSNQNNNNQDESHVSEDNENDEPIREEEELKLILVTLGEANTCVNAPNLKTVLDQMCDEFKQADIAHDIPTVIERGRDIAKLLVAFANEDFKYNFRLRIGINRLRDATWYIDNSITLLKSLSLPQQEEQFEWLNPIVNQVKKMLADKLLAENERIARMQAQHDGVKKYLLEFYGREPHPKGWIKPKLPNWDESSKTSRKLKMARQDLDSLGKLEGISITRAKKVAKQERYVKRALINITQVQTVEKAVTQPCSVTQNAGFFAPQQKAAEPTKGETYLKRKEENEARWLRYVYSHRPHLARSLSSESLFSPKDAALRYRRDQDNNVPMLEWKKDIFNFK